MDESTKTLKWMVDEFRNFHVKKNNEEVGSTIETYCRLFREEVHNICGVFYSSDELTWTFVLEDDSCRIPCILINSASNIERLIKLLENTVVVRKGHLVAEKYALRDGDNPMVWLQVHVDDMFILDVGRPCNWLPLDESHWDQRLLVVHVSTPIINADNRTYSLVLVMTKLPGSTKSQYLWIMLTAKQLQWNLFLIPNREYDFHMTCDRNYFRDHTRDLRELAGGGVSVVRDIHEMLHHDTMWPTTNAVKLPPTTQISLQSSSVDRKAYACKWPPVQWTSVDDALAQENNGQLSFTICGEVVKIYDEDIATSFHYCSLCYLKHSSKCQMSVQNKNSFKMADADAVYNPWETVLKMDEPLRIPAAHDNLRPCLNVPTLPDKLTKNVTLKDTRSGKEVCIYVKFWSHHHYQPVFTPGVILCARLVQKRVSRNNNTYFTTCALSSFEVIGCATSMSNIGGSCLKHGFPYMPFEPQEKVWGVFDTWTLARVTLSHTGHNNDRLQFSASATILVERHSGEPVLVCMRDNNVRILLDIPPEIWTDLKELSRLSPIEYNPNPSQTQIEEMTEIDSVFHTCCTLANAERKRFNIVCRFLSRAGDDYTNDLYYCINLAEADIKHLEDIKDVPIFFFTNQKI